MRIFIPLLVAAAVILPAALPAQQTEPDAEGCKDSKLLTRMPRCHIIECSALDFDSADLIVALKSEEGLITKSLEGRMEKLDYQCAGNVSPLQIVRNVEGAARAAGFKVVYSGEGASGARAITLNKGAQWIEVQASINGFDPVYRQTSVLVKNMEQEIAASADAWAAEIEKSGRVAVYGINFDTGKSTIKAESEPVLQEIINLLKGNTDLKLRVEGHTDSVGAKAANQTLSQQRAASVVSWLVAHGIPQSRLGAQGFGDTKPAGDNATEEGRAKNRRVELVKM